MIWSIKWIKKGGLSHFPDFGSFDNGYSPVPEYFSATWWMMLHLRIYRLYLFIIQMYKNIYTSVTSDSVSEHLNEELHSLTLLQCLCVIKCKMTNNLVFNFWRWKLLKMFHLLCTDFVKYNFVLDWHVHWYVCTAVYVSFIIVSWYWYVTVFGFLPCHFVTNLAPRTSPKHYFLCQLLLPFCRKKNVVLLWYEKSLLKTCTFISLHERYVCSIPGSKHAPDIL